MRRDASGKRITTGALVRVVGIPDLSGMVGRARANTAAVFQHIRGRCKRVSGFDKRGYVELSFQIRSGRLAGRHFVGIEPNLVLVQANA